MTPDERQLLERVRELAMMQAEVADRLYALTVKLAGEVEADERPRHLTLVR